MTEPLKLVYEGDATGAVKASKDTTAALQETAKAAAAAGHASAESAHEHSKVEEALHAIHQQTRRTSQGLAAMSLVMGESAGESSKLVKEVSHLITAFTLGGPLVLGMAAAATAANLISEAFKEQIEEVDKAIERYHKATEAMREMRDEAVKGRATQQHRKEVLELQESDGATPAEAEAAVSFAEKAAEAKKLETDTREQNAAAIASENALYQHQKEVLEENLANVKDAGGNVEIVEAKIEALTEKHNEALKEQNEIREGNLALATQRQHDAQVELDLTVENEAAQKRLNDAKKDGVTDAKETNKALQESLKLYASFAAAPGMPGVGAMIGKTPQQIFDDNQAAGVAAAASLARMYRHVGETLDDMANEASALAESDSRLIDDVIEETTNAALDAFAVQSEFYNAIDRAANAQQEKFNPDLGAIGAAAVSGHGFSAIGGALGTAGGGAASIALGDPTGMIGAGIGGALGSAFGGLIDELEPLTQTFAIFKEIAEHIVAPMGQLFHPLTLLAQGIEMVVDQALVPFVSAFSVLGGELLTIIVEVVVAFLPLITLLVEEMIPGLWMFEQLVKATVPAMRKAIEAVEWFAAGTVDLANQLVEIVNAIADSIGIGDDKLLKRFDSLGDTIACFTAGVSIATPIGPKSIARVVVGEAVVARDMDAGELVAGTVIDVMRREVRGLYTIHLDDGTAIDATTEEHPFALVGLVGWRRAGDLVAGDVLVGMKRNPRIERVVFDEHRVAVVYNVTVAGAHTYFVGDAEVLVHNKDSKKAELKAARDAALAQQKATEDNTKAINDFAKRFDNLSPGYKGAPGVMFNSAADGAGHRSVGDVYVSIGQFVSSGSDTADASRLRNILRHSNLASAVSRRGISDQKG